MSNNTNSFDQLVSSVAQKFDLKLNQVKDILNFSFNEITSLCEKNGKFYKYQFGTFHLKHYPSRDVITPKGNKVTTTPKNKITFTCSSSLIKSAE